MANLKPVVLSAEPSSVDVVLTWVENGPAASSYQIQRNGSVLTTVGTAIRTYTDSAVVEDSVYTYRVRSFGYGTDVISTPVTVQLRAVDKPLVPPVLTGSAGDTQCSLAWTAVPNSTSYTLQRKTGGAYADVVSQAGLTYLNTGRTNGTTYTYRVRGTSQGGDKTGPWSNGLALTPTAGIPVAPVLTGTAGDGENALDWNAVAGADDYRVRRAVEAGPILLLDTTAATAYLDDTAVNGTEYHYSVRGRKADGTVGEISNVLDLTPAPVEPPETPSIVGWAGLAGTNGGAGGTVTTPTSYAGVKSGLMAASARIVRPGGNANFAAGGENLTITNSNLSVEGANASGSFKQLPLQIRASNVILSQLRLRPGDQVNGVVDADGLTINPGVGSRLSKVVIDHCSISWGPDVTFALLNQCEDVTIQYCIIGPGLYQSAHPESPHGYGANVTVPGNGNPNNEYARRITFYRCLWVHNWGRNFKFEHVDFLEVVNCVVYDWGKELGHGNPRGANIVGNMFKKGPETRTSNEVWEPDPTYSQYPNAIYLPEGGADKNIGLGFNPTYNISLPSRRQNYYGGGLHGVTVATPDATLAAAVVAGAGPTSVDAVDQTFKDNFTNGTGGYWYGPGKGTPVPYWP